MSDRKERKNKFKKNQENKQAIKPAYVIGVLALGFILVYALANTNPETSKTLPYEVDAPNEETGVDFISIPLVEVDDGVAQFYEYPSKSGKNIRFFVLKSSDGVYRAAFDACDVCYKEGKGYSQDGDYMVCNNCGKKFISTRINEVRGGCNPAPLKRRVEEDALVIEKPDIEEGARYF
ncbi:MAG: DUF2318 domain-containing protein [Candidatus Altiarchaeales archaeon]|nr:DUF2318 domain-containing protein [Candidatus Altiarchaeales archaeon]